jgi:hypothetical protein
MTDLAGKIESLKDSHALLFGNDIPEQDDEAEITLVTVGLGCFAQL